jgi:hypothetical protein
MSSTVSEELRTAVAKAGVRPQRVAADNAHLAAQVEKLETAQLKLERRIQRENLSPVQRVQLQEKAERIGEKAEKMRATMDESTENIRFAESSSDSHRALAERFREFLDSEEDAHKTDRKRVQRWLAMLIQERRRALHEVEERIQQAKRYILRATIQLDELRNVANHEYSPYEFKTQVGMAREATKDAHGELQLLAHHWSELKSLAHRQDWTALPFSELEAKIDEVIDVIRAEQNPAAPEKTSEDGAESDTDGSEAGEPAHNMSADGEDSNAKLNALHSDFKATAMWLKELKEAVHSAPPPFED